MTSGATYPLVTVRTDAGRLARIVADSGEWRVDIVEPYFNSIIVTCSASLDQHSARHSAAYALSRFTFKAGFIKNNDITFFLYLAAYCRRWVLSIPFFIMLGYLGLDSRRSDNGLYRAADADSRLDHGGFFQQGAA